MKIPSLKDASFYVNRVTEKQDSEGSKENGSKQRQHSKDSENKQREEIEVSDEKINAALEAFAIDQQAIANGLTAASVGTGPGLKIVLKDQAGGVLRHLSGEEFLKLRESVGKDPTHRGKILDQKG